MILKTIIALSVIFNLSGLNFLSAKLDNAIYKDEIGDNGSAHASYYDLTLPEIHQNPEVNKKVSKPNISAYNYLLADLDSGTILYKNNPNSKVPIASTTKIMTAIVSLENYKTSDVVTISENAAYQAGADSYLRVGEEITVGELLRCLLIKSGNDSAYALAEHMSINNDSILEFVAKMNEKAKMLGMKNTEYRDPAGLDVTGYSSAYDLFLATRQALKNELFREIIKTVDYTATNTTKTIFHELKTSNRLVGEYQYPGAIGVKTGYMPEAGHCLVSAAKRNGHTLVGVVLHTFSDTAPASADESRKLLDWGFANTIWHN